MSGKTRDISQARAIAAEKAAALGVSLENDGIRKSRPSSSGSSTTTDYFVFNHSAQQGFTIVSGDDIMPEIIGYTTAGHFDEENIPDGLRYFLSAYQETLHHTVDLPENLRPSFSPLTSVGPRKAAAHSKAVGPLVTTKWAQDWPYNLQCPRYDGTHRAVTGCVATSMAQLMNFYRHPVPQTSGIPGYTTSSYLLWMDPIIGERNYDWDLLLDEYDENSPQASCDEVAKLMFHCGQSVAMDYADGSGAYTIMAYWAFQLYFGFQCEYVFSGECSRSEWVDIINNEIDHLRPFYIGGNDGLSGHAFLCDGRDVDGLHHINWGWAGYCDGFFNILLLDPWSQTQPGFNNGNEIIVGLQLPEGYEVYTAFQHLKIHYNSYKEHLPNCYAGELPGNCDAAALHNFQSALEKAEKMLAESPKQFSVAALEEMQNELTRSFVRLQNSIVPFEDGFYRIVPALPHSAPMALMDDEGLAYWDRFEENDGRFIWQLKYDVDTQSYDVQNIFSDGYISTIQRDAPVNVNANLNAIDYRIALETIAYDEKLGFSYTIRHADDEGSYIYLHQNDASNTDDNGSFTMGWMATDMGSHWRLERVDDNLANDLINDYIPLKESKALLNRLESLQGKVQKLLFKLTETSEPQYDASLLTLSSVLRLKEVQQEVPEYNPATEMLSDEEKIRIEAYCEELQRAYEVAREEIMDVDVLQEFYSEHLQWMDYYCPGEEPGQYSPVAVADFERAMDAVKSGIDNYSLFSRDELRRRRQAAIDALAAIPATFHHFSDGYYYIVSAQWFDGDDTKTVYPHYGDLLWGTNAADDFATIWKLSFDTDTETYSLTDFNGSSLMGGPLHFEGVGRNELSSALTSIAMRRADADVDNSWLHLRGYGRGYEECGTIATGLNGKQSAASLWNLIPVSSSLTPTALPLQSTLHRMSYLLLAPSTYTETRPISISTLTQTINNYLQE